MVVSGSRKVFEANLMFLTIRALNNKLIRVHMKVARKYAVVVNTLKCKCNKKKKQALDFRLN